MLITIENTHRISENLLLHVARGPRKVTKPRDVTTAFLEQKRVGIALSPYLAQWPGIQFPVML